MVLPKWAYLTEAENLKQIDILNKLLKEQSGLTVDPIVLPQNTDWQVWLSDMRIKYQHLRIMPNLGGNMVGMLNNVTAFVAQLKCLDVLEYTKSQWWPNCVLPHAVLDLFTLKKLRLHTEGHVLVIGAGPLARIAVYLAARLGFQTIKLVDLDDQQAETAINELHKIYFNIQLQSLAQKYLTSLPGNSSLVINCLIPHKDDNTGVASILNDLLYLNFLQDDGLVIDFTTIPAHTPLMTEVQAIGGQILMGYDIAARSDYLWLKEALNITIAVDEYAKELSGLTV